MTAVAAASLVALGSVGWGAALLAALGVMAGLSRLERIAWSGAAGLGCLSWLAFFPGIAGRFTPGTFLALSLIGALGTVLLARGWPAARPRARPSRATWALSAVIALAGLLDLAEALSPPVDADSLAYHFALPKAFLAAGRIEFVPRAGDGAVPLLVHMSYAAALGLGGERGLTLWTLLSGWLAALFVFAVCRRHLERDWSLAVAAVFLTTPAVLYGAGSGQVEVRLALFALGAAIAAGWSLGSRALGPAALAGCLAGFFAAGKFTGLLYLAALGAAMMIGRRPIARGAVFAAAAIVCGGQWYVWSWINTGDPVFPVLFAALGLADSAVWDAAHDAYYRRIYFAAETPLPLAWSSYLFYPIIATFGLADGIDAGRTGFGPFAILLLPFAAWGFLRARPSLSRSALAPPAISSLVYYALWIASGTSQRLRHLLPVYPALLLCLATLALRASHEAALRRPLIWAAGASLAIQLGAQSAFAAGHVDRLVRAEARDAFLARNVANYAPVPWINATLGADEKILIDQRQLVYLIDHPVFYAHYLAQVVIDISPRARDPRRFRAALAREGVTHLMTIDDDADPRQGQDTGGLWPLSQALLRAGCAQEIARFAIQPIASRTLARLGASQPPLGMRILALRSAGCAL